MPVHFSHRRRPRGGRWRRAPADNPRMPLAPLAGPAPRRIQAATRLAFFIAGLAMAAWAPLVPLAQQRAGLDEAQLGLLLLCLGTGSLLAMPLSGLLVARHGCRAVLVGATLLIAAVLPALAIAAQPLALAGALFLFGVGMGALDCSVNLQAVMVERDSGRPMMSGFHGLWSVGGIAGAGGVSALLALGLSAPAAVGLVVALLLLALAWARAGFLPHGAPGSGAAFALPRGIVLLIGGLCFIVFLAEGAMLDWSAVFLSDTHGVGAAQAGLGYTAFATMMTLGRLSGDRIVARLGPGRVIVIGALCAAGGLALSTWVPQWQGALAGYALVGLGCSNIVPVLYSAIGRQRRMPESLAVPAVTTLGYAGILIGPAAIGAVAASSSLRGAFIGLALLMLGVAASARALPVGTPRA